MPKIGRERKAKVAKVFKAFLEETPCPAPTPHESFTSYEKRISTFDDPFLKMLVAEGYGEPSQQEYLRRLSDIADMLYQVRNELEAMWPKGAPNNYFALSPTTTFPCAV
jgi:hypothetical protein